MKNLNRKKSDSINAKTRSKSAYKTDAKSKNKLKTNNKYLSIIEDLISSTKDKDKESIKINTNSNKYKKSSRMNKKNISIKNYSMRTSANPHKKLTSNPKINDNDKFEIEYEKYNNLSSNKKNFRGEEIVDYMKKKEKEYKQNKIQQKKLKFDNYNKLYKNIENLEKNIKKKNVHKRKEEKNKVVKYVSKDLINKSNDSTENLNFKKNYYMGCLDVKWILSDNNNSNNLNIAINKK
jgi:hypothetical protein